MQVTPGEQTRDTITAVGRKTGCKKKNTLLIRKDNTVSFRGSSQREAQQPAISSPGCCCGSPETASMQERQLHRIDAMPNNSSICRLPAFALIFFPLFQHNWGGNGFPAVVTGVSLVCARGVCKLDACVAERKTGI